MDGDAAFYSAVLLPLAASTVIRKGREKRAAEKCLLFSAFNFYIDAFIRFLRIWTAAKCLAIKELEKKTSSSAEHFLRFSGF